MQGGELASYYAKRAAEYDRVYDKQERQGDLQRLRGLIQKVVVDARVLEVACGTGYWTRVISDVAKSVLATDIGDEVIALARQREYPRGNVSFEIRNAYDLGDLRNRFDVFFTGFWWSHIPRQNLESFLENMANSLGNGVRAIFFDNRYVEGSSSAISRRDTAGNTYQLRRLEDGSEHEVLKNFPTAAELREAVAPCARDTSIAELDYYWFFSYVIDFKKKGSRS